MKKTVFAFALVMGCATAPKMTKIDQQLYDSFMTKSYSFSKEQCFAATKTALKQMKIGVKSEDPKSGVIISDRAIMEEVISTQGGGYVSSYGSVSTSSRTQKHTAEHKYTLKITGDKSSCKVAVTQYRVWLNNQEGSTVSTDYANAKYWTPFFSAIQDELNDAKTVSQR